MLGLSGAVHFLVVFSVHGAVVGGDDRGLQGTISRRFLSNILSRGGMSKCEHLLGSQHFGWFQNVRRHFVKDFPP